MKTIIISSLALVSSIVLFAFSCVRSNPHSVKVTVKNSEFKVVKSFEIQSNEIITTELDTCSERMKLIINNLSKADNIIIVVEDIHDLFGDGWISYGAEFYAYKGEGKDQSKYYNVSLISHFTDGNILSSNMQFMQNLGGGCFGNDDFVDASNTLNKFFKKAIMDQALNSDDIAKTKIVFENAETGEKTDGAGFMNIVEASAKEKKK